MCMWSLRGSSADGQGAPTPANATFLRIPCNSYYFAFSPRYLPCSPRRSRKIARSRTAGSTPCCNVMATRLGEFDHAWAPVDEGRADSDRGVVAGGVEDPADRRAAGA